MKKKEAPAPKIRSKADLEKIRTRVRPRLELKKGTRIVVGLGTCGMAAGAQLVYDASRTQSSRTLELVLIDNRWQKSVTAFRDPGDLQAAADCLALRVPDARRGKNDQYVNFLQMDESQQEEFERDFRQKQNRRASAQVLQESMNGPQDMILKLPNGEVTSRVSVSLVEDTLKRCLAGEETGFELIPTHGI